MKKNNQNIYTLILKSKNNKELKEVLEILLGKRQLKVLEQRYEILKLLIENKSYIEILRETKTSSATIAKLSNILNNPIYLKYFK
jgi:uncharacterized protein YerC